ncbi:ATP-grasp domain-containing protein [Pirellulaceae bacterium SH467]
MATVRPLVNGRALVFGFSCRALAQSVRRAGLEPWVIDCCGDRDTLDTAASYFYVDSLDNLPMLMEIVSGWRSEGEFESVFFAGGVERLRELPHSITAGSNSPPFSRMRSWETWARWAVQSGIEFPETHSILESQSYGQNQPWLQGRFDDAWLMKDHSQAGGIGVSRFDPAIARRNCEAESDTGGSNSRLILQRRIEGQGFGLSFLSGEEGAITLGGVRSLPHHPHPWSEFIYRGSSGPIVLSPCDWERLDHFAKCVTQESGWLGVWNADFIRTADDRWVLLEINPRWSAGMELIERNWERSIAWHHNNICGNELDPLSWGEQERVIRRERLQSAAPVSKEILYLAKPWKVTHRASEAMWERRFQRRLSETETNWFGDIPVPDVELGAGFPLCSLFITLEDRSASYDRSQQIKDWIQQELGIPIALSEERCE